MLSKSLLSVKTTRASREIATVGSDRAVGSGVHLHVALCCEPSIAARVRADVVFFSCLCPVRDLRVSLGAS